MFVVERVRHEVGLVGKVLWCTLGISALDSTLASKSWVVERYGSTMEWRNVVIHVGLWKLIHVLSFVHLKMARREEEAFEALRISIDILGWNEALKREVSSIRHSLLMSNWLRLLLRQPLIWSLELNWRISPVVAISVLGLAILNRVRIAHLV